MATYLVRARVFDVDDQDFAFAQQMGVSGFPATILQSGEQYFLLTHGYAGTVQVMAAIDKEFRVEKD